MMSCPKCHAAVLETHKFCPSCGTEIPVSPQGVTNVPPPEKPLEYARIWHRVAAYVVDTLVGMICVAVMSFWLAIVGTTATMYRPDVNKPGLGHYIFLAFVTQCLYYTIFETSTRQATPGKMLFGIKVTDLQGKRISFLSSLARTITKFITGMIMPLFLYAAFTKRRQALHDKIGETVVVVR